VHDQKLIFYKMIFGVFLLGLCAEVWSSDFLPEARIERAIIKLSRLSLTNLLEEIDKNEDALEHIMKPILEVGIKPAEAETIKANWKEAFESEHYQAFDMHKIAEMVCHKLFKDKQCLRDVWDKKYETRPKSEQEVWRQLVDAEIQKTLKHSDL
jgi:hypothetical protein